MTTFNITAIAIIIIAIVNISIILYCKYKRKKYLKNANTSTPCKFKLNNKWYDGTILDVTTNDNGVKNVQVAYFDYEIIKDNDFGKTFYSNKTDVKYHYCKLTETKQV